MFTPLIDALPANVSTAIHNFNTRAQTGTLGSNEIKYLGLGAHLSNIGAVAGLALLTLSDYTWTGLVIAIPSLTINEVIINRVTLNHYVAHQNLRRNH